MDFDTPLTDLDGISPQRLRQLHRFGMHRVGDVLTHYPRRHEDRRQFDRFPTEDRDKPVCVCGKVVKTTIKRLPGWKKMFEARIEEQEGNPLSPELTCRWFNVHFVEKMIATGQSLVVYGRPKLRNKNICMDHPEFEIVEDDEEVSIHLRRITPIYRATEGLSQRVLRRLIYELLEKIPDAALANRMPERLDDSTFARALRQIHFPGEWDELAKARRHLVLTEFFAIQLFIAAKREEIVSHSGEPHCGDGHLVEALHKALPFPLTGAQRRAIAEIRADLASPHPMNRLLHGDVGSGKTLVALSAMLFCVESGHQAALMAPTQILAEQHYLNFKRLLEPLGVTVALRTGARTDDTRMPLFEVDNSIPQIVVGTHALLYEGMPFSRLGLVVIDEQHKFGVLQRARLISQAAAPDVLVITATPIPRTLAITLYGDLDVSTLDEMPANRGRIFTVSRDKTKLPEAVKFLREHLEAGRQAYIVYPIIDESDKLEVKAAATEYERWREFLAPMRCELLHGRIPPEEKDAIMNRFRKNETRALIATSVIEVGIDVPNANIMLIENAERFGLAQLHQLRGRIGRGEHKSYCILICEAKNEETIDKLKILEESSDGFEIAEADLRIRGPGDILGTSQSGLPPLKLGDVLADSELMMLARKAAREIFQTDPALERQENKRFRNLLLEGKKLSLSQIS
jgi:ATP-dependent DNA helicase RecG